MTSCDSITGIWWRKRQRYQLTSFVHQFYQRCCCFRICNIAFHIFLLWHHLIHDDTRRDQYSPIFLKWSLTVCREELIGLPTSSWRAGWQASTFQRPFELHGVWGHVQMKYRIYLLKFVKRSNSFFSDLKGAGRTKLHLLRGSNLGQATRFSYNTIHWVAKKKKKKHSGITRRFI